MAVVILGDTDLFSEHELVEQAVEDRGEATYVVETQHWPGDGLVEYAVGDEECLFGTEIPFDEVTGMFSMIQSVFSPVFTNHDWFDGKPNRVGYKQLLEWQRLFRSMIGVFEERGANANVSLLGRYWDLSQPWRLELYRANDIPVAETTFTNDPDRITEFADSRSEVVVQRLDGGAPPELLDSSDLTEERLSTLSAAPIKLQEYVPGRDTRGYVVDGEFAGMIRYEHDPDAISFRGAETDPTEVESTPLDPEPELRETVVRAGELSPTAYAAVDVRLTDDGEFTVMGSNTPGRFAAHDQAGSTDVSGRLAEYLVAS